MTRVSPTVVMKLASPDQRGSTCRCRWSVTPAPEKIFGAPVEPAADGTVYKLVRYERAGYLIVYSRTGGDAPPLVTVTMQKLVN